MRRYQRCLNSASGREHRCYSHVEKRCTRPVFLGRCWLRDRFYRRRIAGYRCVERRLYEVGRLYEGRVLCRNGRRRATHRYTLFQKAPVAVDTEKELRAAWANPRVTEIDVTADILLRACELGDPLRESSLPVVLDGHGHTLRQTCFEKRLLRQDGTGYVELHNVTLTRGGSDGPGAAVTTRGEIAVIDSTVKQNLAEEPGGGIMSQRRATIIRSVITGNLANDDGGGVYARRGGIQVYDSIVSGNLVDGSGGALGSTGDILVVRSHLDGNTTDGDGGAIYTDEDGDVTVIDSTVNGSTADGPGGAIFTLDGDVTIVNSTLSGNRADDRGGAISGEAAVTIIGSTISRNLAVAHVGGGVWSRGDMYVANSTISDNYAEAKGGGLHAAGALTLVSSTVADNIASVAANVGVGERLTSFGSVIGPAKVEFNGGQAQPTEKSCDAPVAVSLGFNVVTEGSCHLDAPTDLVGVPSRLRDLRDYGGPAETRLPDTDSPVLDRVPADACLDPPLPEQLEGEQHLDGLVQDLGALLRTDQRGVPRPQGPACDAGAVEVAAASAARRPAAVAAGDDSPWPRTNAVGRNIRALRREVRRLERQVELMEQSAENAEDWMTCIKYVPVNEQGDRDRQFGYVYDERDGTGPGYMDGIAVDRRRRPGREDYLFMDFRGAGCRSDSPQPGGTAEPASARAAGRYKRRGPRQQLKALERKVERLSRRSQRLETISERFDEWESCVSWVPVTEMGDPDRKFGYLFGPTGSWPGYRAALHVDRADWDDPDYMFLALVGGDRPGRHCQDEPGEAPD